MAEVCWSMGWALRISLVTKLYLDYEFAIINCNHSQYLLHIYRYNKHIINPFCDGDGAHPQEGHEHDHTVELRLRVHFQRVHSIDMHRFRTESVWTFLVGLAITFLIAALTVALPVLKEKFMPAADHYTNIGETRQVMVDRIKLLVYYLLYALFHVANMLIIMSMNIWVFIVVLGAVGTTYYFLLSEKKVSSCCH